MDWYLGNWTASEQDAIIPRFEVKNESANTLMVRLYKGCENEDCFWEAASSTPISATGASLDPVKHADMLNGAFVKDKEKVFFDLTAIDDNLILAEINILTAEGPKSLMLEYTRQPSGRRLSAGNQVADQGGAIFGTISSEQNACSDYTLVVFNPETNQNHMLKAEPGSCSYKIEGLADGSYYYSINVPEGSNEKSRFDFDNPNNPLIIVNGESIQMNVAIKSMSIFEDKTELTSN